MNVPDHKLFCIAVLVLVEEENHFSLEKFLFAGEIGVEMIIDISERKESPRSHCTVWRTAKVALTWQKEWYCYISFRFSGNYFLL